MRDLLKQQIVRGMLAQLERIAGEWYPFIYVKIAPVIVTLLLTACASGYTQFYEPVSGATPELIAARRVAPPVGELIIEHASPSVELDTLLNAYAKRGYALIGSANFNSGQNESEESAIAQGRKVGADLVLLINPKYTGSNTIAMPLTTPTTTTSYSTGTATAYGRNGVVNSYGNSTTTTYGQQTTYIPITVHRMDYAASYFVKLRWSLGIISRDLTDKERQELQSNKGVGVDIVVDDSPAFSADILPGDLILKINGAQVVNITSLAELTTLNSGRVVTISLYRRGKHIEKDVQLN